MASAPQEISHVQSIDIRVEKERTESGAEIDNDVDETLSAEQRERRFEALKKLLNKFEKASGEGKELTPIQKRMQSGFE